MTSQRLSTTHSHTQSSNSVSAWLIEYSSQQYFSLPHTSCHEILESVEVVALSGIPNYGIGLFKWRELWLPLIDFDSLINGSKANSAKNHLTLIVSYIGDNNQTAYAAIALPSYPQMTTVSNDMLCGLPVTDKFDWANFALSCFRYKDSRVPILDANKFFSQPHI